MAGISKSMAVLIATAMLAGCQASAEVASHPTSATVAASLTGTPEPSTTVSSSQPVTTVPPATMTAWTGLTFERLAGQPQITMVVPWSGGYVALGQTGPTGQLGAWTSPDGRGWAKLPDPTFGLDDTTGNTFVIGGTACGTGVLVASEDATGKGTLWWSDSGSGWRALVAPRFTVDEVRQAFLAGGATGAVAAVAHGPALELTINCQAWTSVGLPGSGVAQVTAVAPFEHGFVALDASTPRTSQPHAWWSEDGRQWSVATVAAAPGDDFTEVWPGMNGLMAASTQLGLTPGQPSLWLSSDGRSWKVSHADPFGVVASGEGNGSPAGSFAGDGVRLLGWGSQGDTSDAPLEYQASFDGEHWTNLALSGSEPVGLAGARQVFLMRDGILVSGDSGTWFGSAIAR